MRLFLAFCAASAGAGAAPAVRDYAVGTSSKSFYKPRDVHLQDLGVVNKGSVFFATREGVSALHDGLLTPLIEVHSASLTAFHLCHHRSSLFYEVLSHEGGVLSIYEYSLALREKVKVKEFQDTAPATSLACIDELLLRASPASLLALRLPGGPVLQLQKFSDPDGLDVLSSLTVGFAADVVEHAEIVAVAPHNRSLLRLRISDDDGNLHLHSEMLLPAGDGSDGSLKDASLLEPWRVLWTQGRVLFSDGCAIRQLYGGKVETVLGDASLCVAPGNETLEPVPWSSRLSRPVSMASEAEGTASGASLLLTGAEVVRLARVNDDCAEHRDEIACSAHTGCGWADGADPNLRRCLDCSLLQDWSAAQRPVVEACSLDLTFRAGTRYSLAGCGCIQPTPSPTSTPAPLPQSSAATGTIQGVLTVIVILAMLVGTAMLYRAKRQAAARELYGVDTAELHTFSDNEQGRWPPRRA